MTNDTIQIYNPSLGVDGTIPQLLDLCYRYDSDYSDEALAYIAQQASLYGFDPSILKFLIAQRHNEKDGRLPYEQLKLDKLVYGKIDYEETMDYGEVEIREEGENVLIAVTGMDDEGSFTAASVVPLDEFMSEEDEFLERFVGELLFYGKVYEEDGEEPEA